MNEAVQENLTCNFMTLPSPPTWQLAAGRGSLATRDGVSCARSLGFRQATPGCDPDPGIHCVHLGQGGFLI